MRTFEEQIEAYAQDNISTTSNPSKDEVTQFLKDGVKDVIRKMAVSGLPPAMLTQFSKTETITDANGVTSESNVIFAVTRGDGSYQNPAREIPPGLKGRAVDNNSLFYASKYNPVYYREGGKVYIKPDPTTASVDGGEVVHIVFDNNVNVDSVEIENFPESAVYLVVYYATAMVFISKAGDVHANLPTAPSSLTELDLIYEAPDLPTVPEFVEPQLSLDFTSVEEALENDDPEMADKYINLLDKQLEAFDKEMEISKQEYMAEQNEFEKEINRRMTNADKELGKTVGEIGNKIKSYTADIQKYATEINEQMAKYKWYLQQYAYFMGLYSTGIAGMTKAPKAEQSKEVNVPTQKKTEE